MNAPIAIQGAYTDLKIVRTRKVCQIVVEIPLEASEGFVSAFGMPNPGAETWVALARLEKRSVLTDDGVRPPRARKNWRDVPLSQQAAIACADKKFQRFLFENDMIREDDFNSDPVTAEKAAAAAVRFACGVNTRADIIPGSEAAIKWNALHSTYKAWEYAP